MACPACHWRSALIAALTRAISGLPALTRQDLLGLLALDDEQLLAATKIEDPDGFSRRVKARQHTRGVPTAICRHDPAYPLALTQLDSAPTVLYATCALERLQALLTAPTIALVGNLAHTHYAQQVAFTLAHDLATNGVTIISGLNDGLEGTAHHGALSAHGRNIAVLPCTPDTPPSLTGTNTCTDPSSPTARPCPSFPRRSILPSAGAISPASASPPHWPT